MRYKWYIYMFAFGILLSLSGIISFFVLTGNEVKNIIPKVDKVVSPTLSKVKVEIPEAPSSYVIPMRAHVFQTFNNCGPATLSMALSYFGVEKSQQELGDELRPYHAVGGDNDDKSVTLAEVADKAEEMGLHAYLRPNGTPEKLEKFIALDIPIVTRTWLEENEDIGHYRVVRGYDGDLEQFIQDDSLQGKDLRYSYSDFNKIWQPFNYEFLVIVDDARRDQVEAILGEELDEKTAWNNALERIESEIQEDPNNWHLGFAKSRIYYYLGEHTKSVQEFEKVEKSILFRTLWYQIEPIRAYAELGRRERVFEITDSILNNQNRAFSELYLIRGKFYEDEGNLSAARNEYEKAILYNSEMQEAKDALKRVSS